MSARLTDGGVQLEQRRIVRLVPSGGHLERIEFVDGNPLPCDALFAHPHQRQSDLVRSLGLALDGTGYVQVDEVQRETSIPGIYAAGDLITAVQGALLAAASGTQAAWDAQPRAHGGSGDHGRALVTQATMGRACDAAGDGRVACNGLTERGRPANLGHIRQTSNPIVSS